MSTLPTTKLGHVLTEIITLRQGSSGELGHYRGECKCKYHLDGPTPMSVIELFAAHLTAHIPKRFRSA